MRWLLQSLGAYTFRSTQDGEKSDVAGHRAVLAAALKAKGMSHAKIAKAMGWRTPSTAGHKLSGRNDWHSGELERMCELAGITIVSLAAESDDLHLTNRPEAVEGAKILDEIPAEDLAIAIAMLRAYRDKPKR